MSNFRNEKQNLLLLFSIASELSDVFETMKKVGKKCFELKDTNYDTAAKATLLAIISALQPINEILQLHEEFAENIKNHLSEEESNISLDDIEPLSDSVN